MIKILGVGNILYGDEGFGSHFSIKYKQELESLYKNQVEVIDGGVHSIPLIPLIEGAKYLIIVDALKPNPDTTPGQIFVFDKEDLLIPYTSRVLMTSHDGGVWELLEVATLMDKLPEHINLVAIVPQDLSTRLGLSPLLQQKLEVVKQKVVELIENFIASSTD
jgi:hydrogenase maturation protease